MVLLTFMKYALTQLGACSSVEDDLTDESPADAVELSPYDASEEVLTWFSLSLDRRAPDQADDDELARLSLTTSESEVAAHADFERWM
ncbi:hypothetical protein V5E97_01295 [Singulisphaera sp. Ch08]|uniref:Uncharacterized protein n=1 Tax=Singulisphaera sp. Ch08 TaxID=3120278 RepID=A0AAU7CI42_9BACT